MHVQRRVRGDVTAAARRRFEKLGLAATRERNGALLFVALDDRRFCVLGDEGIHRRVAPDFWAAAVALMAGHFRNGDVVGGIEAGVREIGRALRELFPRQPEDLNELPDDASLGAR